MWPLKKKRKKTLLVPDRGDLDQAVRILDKVPKKAICTKNTNCVCTDCPKLMNCPVELACRKTDCENYIVTCSLKAQALGGPGALSDFADMVATIRTRNLIRSFTADEQSKMAKDMRRKVEEEEHAKKSTSQKCGTNDPFGAEPSVLG